MKIIVPMAGPDASFVDEFGKIKPLTEIDGRVMIEHIASMFPQDSNMVFLCRKQDLQKGLDKALEKTGKKSMTIVPIERPTKDIIDTLSFADEFVHDDEEIVIVHADSYQKFDFNDFISYARNYDGVLTVFSGFNPADPNTANFGRIGVTGDRVIGVFEKQKVQPSQVTAAGCYYFSSWAMFKKYVREMMRKNYSVNGKFFDSPVYNEMIADGKKVVPYAVKWFVSFGEPWNVKEYIFWSEYFNYISSYTDKRKEHDLINLVPSAGRGKRFADLGYMTPKPLIKVLGKEMILACADALPKAGKNIFVILKEQADSYALDKVLKKNIANCEVVVIDQITDGMARTCLMAEHLLDKGKQLVISSCDYSFVYDDEKLQKVIAEEQPDAMIWTFREYPDARLAPNAYGYVVVEDGRITKISEKVPVSDQPHKDHIVQGTFWFKNAELFLWAAKEMISKGVTINGEYYVATAINELIANGKKVVPFELEKYICWGTPLDLWTFEFWENYFSQLDSHPYKK
ncbi:MAG: NTP transferase domain-containing protein [Candidatus Aenigmarchaeota archaeon]|nr:NTP transferase domain-containing protein [Candidatus Aenigmarchaeota archaeon]